jgi:hypothetical protein
LPTENAEKKKASEADPSGFTGPTPRLGSRGVPPTELLYV